MTELSNFTSDKEPLSDLLKSIQAGKTQLPDFQRGWVWDNDHICSLLASISLSYPIGAVMLLQTGGEARFKPRLIEGVVTSNGVDPERLILDGQQRLTSLYQALCSRQVVNTKDARGYPLKRWYYLDIKKALDPALDREDAIVSLPEDKVTRSFRGEIEKDYSTPEKEYEAELLPLPLVFSNELMNWQMGYFQTDPSRMAERMERWKELNEKVLQCFQLYHVPTIVLKKNTPKVAVCKVFEKVNTGGVSLTVFELLTATYAIEEFNLRDDWRARDMRLKRPAQNKVLAKLQNTDFLQAVALLATLDKRSKAMAEGKAPEYAPAVSCKRKDILKLSLADYKQWADVATVGYEKAARFLFTQKIFDARDLPYQTQLVPLACILALLGNEMEKESVRTKVAQWYWCGVMGELYGSAIETRFAKDLVDVLEWIRGGDEPTTVVDASFVPARLLSLRTRNSAAYKGLHALLMLDGVQDFRSGEEIDVDRYFDNKIDIHHIFPQRWCTDQGIDPRVFNSAINKTPLSARTNRIIGGRAPSTYLSRVQNSAGIDEARMDEILATHSIDSSCLRADNFTDFFAARQEALLLRIESAMGKPIARDSILPAEDVIEGTDDQVEE